ncbi:MAG: hypothetical protein LBS30_04335, partial [Planctomycetota bacterium]|nr:hypothetical protein [Planctomycetota bacterium]
MSTESTGSSTSRSRVTGLASGFDTQSIVDSLMSLEKIPYTKLEVKKETEDVKLQAYQAVNTYLLKLRTALNSMSSKKLWNSNATVSTNEKSITANANEYAVKGTYNFRVAQLATAAQYMTKGFSSKNAPLVKDAGTDPDAASKPLGSISVASAKTRVDNSAKLDTMNGGKGVYRGSVRVTDAAGNTSVIDLSACDTLDDVARALSDSPTAQITSYVDEKGRLCIQDSSNGSGRVRVQNVGAGTTASDLGIAGMSEPPAGPDENALLVGENAYTLGNEMSLSLLNDGLGIEGGNIQFTVNNEAGDVRSFYVNVEDCETVGDVIKRVNDAFDAERGLADANLQPGQLRSGELADLRFGLSEDKTGFALIGARDDITYAIGDRDGFAGKASPSNDLGLTGRYIKPSGGSVEFGRVLGSANSPMLKSLTGAGGAGVGRSSDPDSDNGKVFLPFNGNTLLSTLNKGNGLDLSTQFRITSWEGGQEGGRQVVHEGIISNVDLQEKMADGTLTTVDDLLAYMNDKLAAYAGNPANDAAGLKGVSFSFNPDYGAVAVTGAQVGYDYEILGSVPYSLGLQRYAGNGTAIGLDPANFAGDQAIQNEVDKFYGVGAGYSSKVDVDNATIDDSTVLGDMLKLAGLDKEGYTGSIREEDYPDEDAYKAALQAAEDQWASDSRDQLNATFSSPTSSFSISVDQGDGTMVDVEVRWADVAAA